MGGEVSGVCVCGGEGGGGWGGRGGGGNLKLKAKHREGKEHKGRIPKSSGSMQCYV